MNTKPSTAHITKEWVMENCKIVRKTKEMYDSVPLYDNLETIEFATLELIIKEIVEELDHAIGRFVIYRSSDFEHYIEDSLRLKLFTEYGWDDKELRLGIQWKVKETYDQAVKRTVAAEKRKITQSAKQKEKEDKERKLYEKLRQKFGD